jgi:uncharacterized protein YjbJ (UPF0337 family)
LVERFQTVSAGGSMKKRRRTHRKENIKPAQNTAQTAGSNWDSFLPDKEDSIMNKDIAEGKWKQIRGEAKSWWGKLTDDDLDRAAGKFDVLAGLLQEKYGYSRQRATEEIDKRVTEYEAGLKKKNVKTSRK